MTHNFTPHQERILDKFGLAIQRDGSVVLADANKARTCDLHHTFLPIAMIGWGIAAPEFIAYHLSDYSLERFVLQRSNMDYNTAEVLAAVSGLDIKGPFNYRTGRFFNHLLDLLAKRGLDKFFKYDPAEGELHWGVRPRDWIFIGTNQIPLEAKIYRSLSPAHGMLIATTFWLYNGAVPTELRDTFGAFWKASEAIPVLRKEGLFADWAKLVVLYPGW